ncbi:TetR/AcrR family transcriptional regulator [Pontibacillus halophilus]|uniref:TetR/AcrR family transcriptional regulator n=1 Tax=Pontibacillus halophilus TaxID=516704 RepID=UPI0003F99ADB|nr:TetR/AcrR family transcriptional regulator [Pontibacillus halophilus]
MTLIKTKRDDILEAALTLFAERGAEATTIPMVAKQANVGAGTIYRYFDNKDVLVNDLFQLHVQQLTETLQDQYPSHASTRQQFNHIFTQLVTFTNKHEDALYFIKTHNHAHILNQPSQDCFQRLLELIRSFYENGQSKDEIRMLPSNALIAIVLGAFLEYHKLVREGQLEETDELLEGIEASCWDAIRTHS